MITSDPLASGHSVLYTCVSSTHTHVHTTNPPLSQTHIQADRQGEVDAPVSPGGFWAFTLPVPC